VNDPKIDLEYAPIEGDASFNKAVRGVLFGWDHQDVNSGRVASL
jgi:aspartate/tyrosine/aromatic aminotransferase